MAVAVLLPATGKADVLISDFGEAECVQGRYGSWENAKLAQRDARWTVTASGFGGAFKNLVPPHRDASAEAMIELTVRIGGPSQTTQPVIAGPLVVLEDAAGNQWIWAWYGLSAGRHVLRKSLDEPSFTKNPSAPSRLDFSRLVAFHIQVDPGQSAATYQVTFEQLRLVTAKSNSVE